MSLNFLWTDSYSCTTLYNLRDYLSCNLLLIWFFFTSKPELDWWVTWCEKDLNGLYDLMDDYEQALKDRKRVAWYFSALDPQDPPTEGYLVLKDRLTKVDIRMGNICCVLWLCDFVWYAKGWYWVVSRICAPKNSCHFFLKNLPLVFFRIGYWFIKNLSNDGKNNH